MHNIFHTQAREKKGGTICAPLERNKREKQFKLRGAARGEGVTLYQPAFIFTTAGVHATGNARYFSSS